jgi:hypothetical protein
MDEYVYFAPSHLFIYLLIYLFIKVTRYSFQNSFKRRMFLGFTPQISGYSSIFIFLISIYVNFGDT